MSGKAAGAVTLKGRDSDDWGLYPVGKWQFYCREFKQPVGEFQSPPARIMPLARSAIRSRVQQRSRWLRLVGGATAYDFGANNLSITSDAALEIRQNITTTGRLALISNAGISTGNIGATNVKAKITAWHFVGKCGRQGGFEYQSVES